MTAKDNRTCQLTLVTPGGLASAVALEAFAGELGAALDAVPGAVAAVVLRSEGLNEESARRAAAVLAPVAQERDVAFLVEDRPAAAEAANADGVHMTEQQGSVAETRTLIGPEAIVGVACGTSRHRAIGADEAGADYVAFAGDEASLIELLAWWQEMMTLPCVAFGAADLESAARLAGAGADFIAVDDTVWLHPAGAAAGITALTDRLAESDH